MAFNGVPAGSTNGGVAVEGLLHHRAEQVSHIRPIALHYVGAKVDVGKDAFARVGQLLVRCAGEQAAGHIVQVTDRSQRRVFRAREMMKKAPFGRAGCGANVVQLGGTVTFAADNFECSTQQSGLRAVRDGS